MTKLHAETRKEYMFSTLSDFAVVKNPLDHFSDWLDEADREGVEEPRAMVLSTTDPGGGVSGRVVLLKGIEKGGFLFFTNYESRKGVQLAANPLAALTFFWPKVERQVRVVGKVVKVSRRESVSYFNSRPVDSRISACISPQSSVIPDRAFLEAMREGFLLDLNGHAPECPENWGGYRLKPALIEFWQGRVHRLHDRLRYIRHGSKWMVERLAP
jgi:pyridoxamine 5'-phosphate oxidase